MSYKLYSWHGNPRGWAVRIVADIANVDYEFVNTTIPDAKTEDFQKNHHALGKTPLLEGPEGSLFETNAILKFLGNKAGLVGDSVYAKGQVDQWNSWINSDLFTVWAGVAPYIYQWKEFDEAAFKKGRAALFEKLKFVDEYLKHHTYLAGESLSIADIHLFSLLQIFYATILDEGFRRGHFSIIRWLKHVNSNKVVAKYYRPYTLTKNWFNVKVDKPEPKKTEKPKQKQQPKKEEKKEEKKDDQAIFKKAKNPLEELPPSDFGLFDFKTFIVNEKDKVKGVEEFFKQCDFKGFSIWHIKYDKYEGEGVKLFLTSNFKDSFLQRLDHFRKYSFGVIGVYGEEGNYDVEGVLVWRGTETPQEIKDLPNYEYFFWNKLDNTNEEHKKMLQESWTGFEEDKAVFNGKVARDVGYFK